MKTIRSGYRSCALLLTAGTALSCTRPPPRPDAPPIAAALSASSAVSIVAPNIPWGGRAVTVTIDPTNAAVALAAADTGGLFRTADGGITWAHLDGLGQFRMSDVQISPRNHSLVAATTVLDTHVSDQGGIWLSRDGGTTWSRPAAANAAPGCARSTGHGIAFAPDRDDLFVGHDCGLAVSHDAGVTWSQVDMGGPVIAVTSQAGGIADVLGSLAGGVVHRRSLDGGTTFGAGASSVFPPRANAVHSLTASPLDSRVLFATGSEGGPGALFESTDGGATWHTISAPFVSNRPPFVTAVRSHDGNPADLDLYYGDGQDLLRQTCTGATCPGNWQFLSVDHADPCGVAFAGTAICPSLLATDGGIHRTTDCGATWTITGSGAGGYTALQMNDVVIQVHPDHSDLYFGTQDNGVWASGDNGVTWPFLGGVEVGLFQLAHTTPNANGVTVAYSTNGARLKSGALFSGISGWRDSPGALSREPFLVGAGLHGQVSGPDLGHLQLFLTRDLGTTWSAVPGVLIAGDPTYPPAVAGPASDPTIYLPFAPLTGGVSLLKITHIFASSATIVDVGRNGITELGHSEGQGLWPVFGVDPGNPDHLILADGGSGQMKVSTNGGATFAVDGALTDLVTAHGALQFRASNGQCQARVVAFSPADPSKVIVGTEANGVFASTDGGASWFAVNGSAPVVPAVAVAFDEVRGAIYVSTQGRGLWRIDDPVSSVDLSPTADAYVRDGTSAGTNFGTASTLVVKNSTAGNNRVSYLRFSLAGVAGSVTAARLRLFGSRPTASPVTDSAFSVASNSWVETGINWNNRPALGTRQGSGVAVGTAAAYYEWDVTAFVNAQKSAGASEVSLAVTMDSSVTASPDAFNAREAASNPPHLVVTIGAGSNAAPTVATPASASPSPVTGSTTALAVLGADDQGEGALTYTWSTTGTPPAPVTFSANGTNAAKATTATFAAAGTHAFQVTIRDAGGLTASSAVSVTVTQTSSSLAVAPATATVAPGQTQQFSVTARDQFGAIIAPAPAASWSVSGGGTISGTGLFTAGPNPGGPFTVTATSGGVNGTAAVTVAARSTLTLAPVADAYVRDGTSASTNFGTASTLLVKNSTTSGNNRVAYLRFSLTGVGGQVSAATLRLFGSRPTLTGITDSVFAVASNSWGETSITWNNRPAAGARQGSAVTVTATAQYYQWDLTAYLQAQKAAGATAVSLAVSMDASTSASQDTFNAREASANRPELVVTSSP
jgi:hypothetical protein